MVGPRPVSQPAPDQHNPTSGQRSATDQDQRQQLDAIAAKLAGSGAPGTGLDTTYRRRTAVVVVFGKALGTVAPGRIALGLIDPGLIDPGIAGVALFVFADPRDDTVRTCGPGGTLGFMGIIGPMNLAGPVHTRGLVSALGAAGSLCPVGVFAPAVGLTGLTGLAIGVITPAVGLTGLTGLAIGVITLAVGLTGLTDLAIGMVAPTVDLAGLAGIVIGPAVVFTGRTGDSVDTVDSVGMAGALVETVGTAPVEFPAEDDAIVPMRACGVGLHFGQDICPGSDG